MKKFYFKNIETWKFTTLQTNSLAKDLPRITIRFLVIFNNFS